MKREEANNLAQKIVDCLFRNGFGERASRLVLELGNGKDGGGWAEGPARNRIADILTLHKPPKASKG